MVFHSSLAGATGSGVMTLILERLDVEYSKIPFINNLLYASNKSDVEIVTEPYNAVLATGSLIEHSALVITNSNAGLSNYCQMNQKIETPTLIDYNRVNSNAFSHLLYQVSNSQRSSVIGSIDSLISSLIPYRRLDFVIPAFS
jgi:hypothetical protein